MTCRLRRARSLEKKFLQTYSVWQETHQLEQADRWMSILGELLKLNPHYSVRHPFQGAF